MAQEEQFLSSSHSDDTGHGGILISLISDRPRNVKQKKVPQRGLGVAQLEKIRLEEQRKRDSLQAEAADVLAPNAVRDTPNHGSNLLSPCLSPSSTHFSTPNSVYRSTPSIPLQITKQEIAMQSTNSGPVSSNWPRPRQQGGESNLEGEKQMVDNRGYAFAAPVSFQYETDARQRSFRVQRLSASSVVNSNTGISPSSVFSSQVELPSNQILRGNNYYTASCLEEEKIVGMKRPYSFFLESPLGCSFLSDFHPSQAACRSRSDELQVQEPRMTYIRDCLSNPCVLPEQNLIEAIEDDGRMLNGDFLTLAPPVAGFPSSRTTQKKPLDYSSNQRSGLQAFNFLPCQESLHSKRSQLGHGHGSAERPFSCFAVESNVDQSTACLSNGNGEQSETMDLNLKL